MLALLPFAFFLLVAGTATATSHEWMLDEERVVVHALANSTGLLKANASGVTGHNNIVIGLWYFLKHLDDAKMTDDDEIVGGSTKTYGTIGSQTWRFVRKGDQWRLETRIGRFLDAEEGLIDVEITVDGPGSAPSYITYRLPDSPPFIIANVIYRGVAGGEWAANGGYDPNDRTVWLGTRPKVLSRWIHGEAYLDKDRIDAPEVQITLHAMPFRTSGEVIRFLCYVAGSKPEDLKSRRNAQHSDGHDREPRAEGRGVEL